jgi:hypothetical protein
MKPIFRQPIISLTLPIFIMLIISPELSGQTSPAGTFPQLLFPNFSRGIIMMKSGKTTSAFLDYNTVEEEMLFEQNGNYMVINKPDEIDTISLQNRKFVPVEQAFYEVIVKGHVSLYIQHRNRFTPVGTKTAYGITSPTAGASSVSTVRGQGQSRNLEMPPNVTISPAIVYWVKMDGVMSKFTTERQFIKIFPGMEDKIKGFLKNSKLDLKSREGLLQTGKFCNELYK